MPIGKRYSGYLVTVNRGGKRVRKQFNGTYVDAKALEDEIGRALEVYGKWPIEADDLPLEEQTIKRRNGTLRIATELALNTHWKGTAYREKVDTVIWNVVVFFEDRGKADLDAIESEDIDAFIEWCRNRGNKGITINKRISMLSVISNLACKRIPPLATRRLPLRRVKESAGEKWWLRPDDLEDVLDWLHGANPDPLFADYISMMVLQGLRVSEAHKLEPRHFTDMNTKEPWLQVPGTKTTEAGNSIPVFEDTIELVKRCLERCSRNRWTFLFPMTERQLRKRWNEVRVFLGVRDVDSATLRSLRRTFAYYANSRGMPTRTLQKILRHETITTTEGYLKLVGTQEADQARDFMMKKQDEDGSGLAGAMAAYRETGASPEEVARFVKELMG